MLCFLMTTYGRDFGMRIIALRQASFAYYRFYFTGLNGKACCRA